MSLLTNLVSYYKLDESSGNAADSVGSNTLTNNNTVTYAAGKINNGADGGSSNTNKSLSSANNLGISSAIAPASFSAWINVSGTVGAIGSSFTFLSHATATTGYLRSIIYEKVGGTTNTLHFSMYGTSQTLISYAVTLTPGTWHHVVIVDDGTNGTLYLDGSAVAGPTTRATGTSSGWLAELSLLSRAVPDTYTSGLIDEVGVWTRALSAGEVTTLYNSGAGLTYPFTTNNAGFLLNFI